MKKLLLLLALIGAATQISAMDPDLESGRISDLETRMSSMEDLTYQNVSYLRQAEKKLNDQLTHINARLAVLERNDQNSQRTIRALTTAVFFFGSSAIVAAAMYSYNNL